MTEDRTVMFQMPSGLSGTLACLQGTVVGRSWQLSAGTFVIGRAAECDLSLAQEPGVSKVHAKIVAEGDCYVIADCESRNGTIVNGAAVQRAVLRDGDEIRICGCTLRFAQQGGGGGVAEGQQRSEGLAPSVHGAPGDAEAPGASAGRGRSRSRVLLAWYAGGVAGGLLLGIPGAVLAGSTAPTPTAETLAAAPQDAPSPGADPAAGALDVKGVQGAGGDGAAGDPAAVAKDEPVANTPPGEANQESGMSWTYPATAEPPRTEMLRARAGGRVRSVGASAGDSVRRGQTLVTFEATETSDDVATLKDRIASLEAVAAEDEQARRSLAAARAKLESLTGGAGPVVSPAAGRLVALDVSAGSTVKPGEVVGRVLAEGEGRVRITTSPQHRVVRGASVTLVLKSGGEAKGRVDQVSGQVVSIDTGGTSAHDVESVRF